MKIQVICENCGKMVELVPETQGQLAYVHSKLWSNEFYVSDTVIECSSTDDIEEISDFDDITIDKELKEVRIDCRDCGNYIVLTDFGR